MGRSLRRELADPHEAEAMSVAAAARERVVTHLQGGTYTRVLTIRSAYSETVPLESGTTTTADVHVRAITVDGPDRVEIRGSRDIDLVVLPLEVMVAGAVASKAANHVDSLLRTLEEVESRMRSRAGATLSFSGGLLHFLRTETSPMAEPTDVQNRRYAVLTMTAYYVYQSARPA